MQCWERKKGDPKLKLDPFSSGVPEPAYSTRGQLSGGIACSLALPPGLTGHILPLRLSLLLPGAGSPEGLLIFCPSLPVPASLIFSTSCF